VLLKNKTRNRIMNTKRIILLSLIILGGMFVFRKAILGKVSKGWEKEFFTTETTNFKIDVKTNLEKGCPKSGIFYTGDTLEICNYKLKDLIHTISSTTINNSEFIGRKYDSESRYNFSYYPKDSAGFFKVHKMEILSILGKEFNFTYKYDSIESIVYKPTILDYNKLNKKISSDTTRRTRLGDNYIQFMGCSLNDILLSFDYFIKDLVIESNFNDSLYYSFNIPSMRKGNIISHLHNDFGIKLSEEEKRIEILTIKFKE